MPRPRPPRETDRDAASDRFLLRSGALARDRRPDPAGSLEEREPDELLDDVRTRPEDPTAGG